MRAALRGLDGGPQLRAALDELRRHNPCEVVFVDNGGRGPAIVDTRALPAGGWVLEGLLPPGVVAALADLDDPSPRSLLAGGFDVVVLLGLRGAPVRGAPVRVSVYFHRRLGQARPAPFTVCFTGAGWQRVEEAAA